jgi:hypothetical protein
MGGIETPKDKDPTPQGKGAQATFVEVDEAALQAALTRIQAQVGSADFMLFVDRGGKPQKSGE